MRYMILAVAVLLAGCGGSAGSSVASLPAASAAPAKFMSTASIWIHGHPYSSNFGGATDFDSLFAGTSGWATVAARTSAFGLYSGWVNSATNTEISQLSTFLAAQHMTTEVEAPSLQATASCGSGVEGFVPYGGQSLQTLTLAWINRLQNAGIPIGYVKVDEPYFFGSVSTEANACQWPVAMVAAGVAQFSQLVHSVSPATQVGDVEPVVAAYPTDPVTALSQWQDAYKSAAGSGFPFYVADADFNNPSWTTWLVNLESAIHARGEQFGVIYIGDFGDTSDQQWSGKVVARFEAFQGAAGGTPDFVLFQSWLPHPTRSIPETDQTTQTGVVRTYLTATGR
ncbi:MAG: hypothetical protein JO349_05190 [Candidatus Eremiobacteraeota bacterium]|nr:hypothetical protein [Candidatus Eremiobacteraeota bacterium]